MNVKIGGKVQLLYFSGAINNDHVFIVGTPSSDDCNLILEEISRINNEHTNDLRMALKNLSLEIEKRIAADSRFFDELTRLNNELIMAKRELTQKNLELEAVNRELQRCNIELENAHNILQNREKLSIVGQMAAGMAHEVKNPLTAVRGMAQLLKERCAPEHSRLADAIIEETHRA
ncbi:histidine kinase dimerization/phospho-acceptor domain-containing protein [Desulforamulus putei]|uniref:histidine kinase dimerization/phospho-acceptor domain-containing protein n=1 Tax=Desulforamulus putei TaxID=74701 RepID=UPI002FDE0DD6